MRGCLISITIACSRLRRSPDGVGVVENARSAFSTTPTPFFARRSRASTQRERAKTLRIKHALKKEQQQYTIWIEAEQWVPGSWNPEDDNTDVIVTWEDGSRWVATFFAYQNVQTLSEKNRRTGESLSGAYFWASDMILADKVSRQRIEQIIEELIKTGEFETIFTPLP